MAVQHTKRHSSRRPKFPNRVREYRLKAGLSQRKLAALLGLGRHAVSAWERGISLPSFDRGLQLAIELETLAESIYVDLYRAYREARRLAKPTNA